MRNIDPNKKGKVLFMSDYTNKFECCLCNKILSYKKESSFFDVLKKHSINCKYSYCSEERISP